MKRPLSLVMAIVLLSGTVLAQESAPPPNPSNSPNDQKSPPSEPPSGQPNNSNDQYGGQPQEQPNNPNDQMKGPPSGPPPNDQNAPPSGPPNNPNDQNAPPSGPPSGQPNNQMMSPQSGPASARSNQWSWHGRWRNRIRGPVFRFPPGWGYRRWRVGQRLPPALMSPRFFQNVVPFGMGRTPPGRRWVRFGPDLLLVNVRTRRIEDAVYNVFW